MLDDRDQLQAELSAHFSRSLDAQCGSRASVVPLHSSSPAASLHIEVVSEIDSTSSELMRRGRSGDHTPVLLMAERQTAGRGRLGRTWENGTAEADRSSQPLMFSLGLPLTPRSWSGLSLAVGVGIADGLDPMRTANVGVKWPNDLWFKERKLCGILIETVVVQPRAETRFVVIGVGINIGRLAGAGMRTPPAWVREWRAGATAANVLQEIVPPLLRDVAHFCENGFSAFTHRFAARDVLRGREVSVSGGPEGLCEGVGAGGELLLRTATGLQAITSSEVSVRPGPAPLT